MKTRVQLAALLLLATMSVAQTPVVPGSILGSLTPITSSNGTLNAVFPVIINTGAPTVLVQLDQTTTITAGAIRFQVSYDGTNYVNASSDAVTDPTSATNATISMPYSLQVSTNKAFSVALKGAQALQILVSTAMTGTGAITPYYSALPTLPAGLQLFGLNAEAGTAITNVPTAIGAKGTGNVMSVNSDLTSIAGGSTTTSRNNGTLAVGGQTATNTAVSGDTYPLEVAGSDYGGTPNKQVLKVDSSGRASVSITGGLGTTLDVGGGLIAGAKVQAPQFGISGSGPLTMNQTGELQVHSGGGAYLLWDASTFTDFLPSSTIQAGSVVGTLELNFSGITGSPSGCAVTTSWTANINLSTLFSNAGYTTSVLGTLSTTKFFLPVYMNTGVTSAQSPNSAALGGLQFKLSCSVYPTAGTVTGAFVAAQTTNIAGANGYAAFVSSTGQLESSLYDVSGNGLTSDSTTYSSNFALDGNLLGTLGTAFSTAGKVDVKAADGDDATLGAKGDAKSTSTDTTAVSAISVLKEISAMEQAPASRAVTNAGTFAVQAAESDGANVTLGAKADAKSTATDTTAITAMQVLKEISAMEQAPASRAVTQADGADVTLGAKADAKSTSTDTTPITAMQVLKEISAMEQAPASRAVTNAGTFAVQDTLQAGSAIAGKFGIDQTTPGTTNADEPVPDTASAVALTTTTKSSLTSASNVKSSAGNVYGLFASNGAAAQCWVQVINNAGAGTLGTGVIFSVPMAASGSVVIPPGTFAMANFSSGISVGIASTTNAASACGTAGTVVLFYK